MSQVLYSPFRAISGLQRELDQAFDYQGSLNRKVQSGPTSARVLTGDWTPAVDIQESEAEFQIFVELPGVKDTEIEVTLEKKVLTIKGDRSISPSENFTYKRQERSSGTFVRQFTLPDSVDDENISAKSDLGILKIVIPKASIPKPLSIVVEGSNSGNVDREGDS
ncbi:MAG: HSP20 family protein [Candidatus Azotimanducaceae bacterium]|jgi:HSP20 family protein